MGIKTMEKYQIEGDRRGFVEEIDFEETSVLVLVERGDEVSK